MKYGLTAMKTHSDTMTTEATACEANCSCRLQVILLRQENKQLQQEMQNAYYRIRELEAMQFISNATEEDDGSVSLADDSFEVQSVLEASVTSSIKTLPTGSALANQKRREQQQRDERESSTHKRRNQKLFRFGGRKQNRNYSKRELSYRESMKTLYEKEDARLDPSLSECPSISEISSSDATSVSENRYAQRPAFLLGRSFDGIDSTGSEGSDGGYGEI